MSTQTLGFPEFRLRRKSAVNSTTVTVTSKCKCESHAKYYLLFYLPAHRTILVPFRSFKVLARMNLRYQKLCTSGRNCARTDTADISSTSVAIRRQLRLYITPSRRRGKAYIIFGPTHFVLQFHETYLATAVRSVCHVLRRGLRLPALLSARSWLRYRSTSGG